MFHKNHQNIFNHHSPIFPPFKTIKTISVSPGLSPIELAVFTMSSQGRMATQASPMFACRRGQLIEAGPFQLLLARCGWEIHGTMESDDTIVILL